MPTGVCGLRLTFLQAEQPTNSAAPAVKTGMDVSPIYRISVPEVRTDDRQNAVPHLRLRAEAVNLCLVEL
jgi:hypothetical protein